MSFSQNHINAHIEIDGEAEWRFTSLYGFPKASRKKDTWSLLTRLAPMSDLPWCVMGDYNCIMCASEKLGGARYPKSQMEGLSNVIRDNGLFDMGFVGSKYTWNKGDTFERLDRGSPSQGWLSRFSNYEVQVLGPGTSDHSPLLLLMDARAKKTTRSVSRFKFEEMWL